MLFSWGAQNASPLVEAVVDHDKIRYFSHCCWDLMPNRSSLGVINYSQMVESSVPLVELPGFSWVLCLRLLKDLLSPAEHVCHGGACSSQKKKKNPLKF